MDKLLDAIAGNFIAIAAFMVPIGIVFVTNYFGHKRLELIHRERMAAIEHGLMPPGELGSTEPEEPREEGAKTPPNYLRRGLFWLCPGVGLVAFSLLFLNDVMAAIRLPILGVSIALAGVGAAYLTIYVVEAEKRTSVPMR